MELKAKKRKSKLSERSTQSLVEDLNLTNPENQESFHQEESESLYVTTMSHSKHSFDEQEEGEGNWLISYADMMTLLFGFFALLMSFSKIDVETFEKSRQEATKYFGGEYKLPTAEISKEIKKEVLKEYLMDQMSMQVSGEGITVSFRGALFFEAGSIDLKKEAKGIIEKIVPILKKQSAEYIVMIEGHTDDSPINTIQFPSNWELSSYRAASVLHFFEQAGFPKNRLRAIGYGDTEPILPNRDKNGNPLLENQTQNRRVVIRMIRTKI